MGYHHSKYMFIRTPRPDFVMLAKRRKFDRILRILEQDNVDHQAWLERRSATIGRSSLLQLFKTRLPLHVLLNYRPPLCLVNVLIRTLAEFEVEDPVVSVDMFGRTPLHVAAASGCNVLVVERLLNGNAGESLLGLRDYWGRSALHWVVSQESKHIFSLGRKCRRQIKELETTVEVVHALVNSCPDSVKIVDDEGKTPFDLGEQHKVHKAVLCMLHFVPATKQAEVQKGDYMLNSYNENTETTMDVSLRIPAEVWAFKKRMYDASDVSSVGTGGMSRLFVKSTSE